MRFLFSAHFLSPHYLFFPLLAFPRFFSAVFPSCEHLQQPIPFSVVSVVSMLCYLSLLYCFAFSMLYPTSNSRFRVSFCLPFFPLIPFITLYEPSLISLPLSNLHYFIFLTLISFPSPALYYSASLPLFSLHILSHTFGSSISLTFKLDSHLFAKSA